MQGSSAVGGALGDGAVPTTPLEKLRHGAKSLTVEVVVLERVPPLPRHEHEPTTFLVADGESALTKHRVFDISLFFRLIILRA